MARYKHTVIAKGKTLNFHFPKCWQELTQKQLKAVLVFLSAYDKTTALLRITLYFANMVIVEKSKKVAQCRVVTDKGMMSVNLTADDMLALTEAMQWVMEPGAHPVLLDELGGRKAIDKFLHGVPFETYLMLDNLYQGYLMSQNPAAIIEMANFIYPPVEGEDDGDFDYVEPVAHITELQPYELFSIVQWYTQLKALYVKEFGNLFKPVNSGTTPSVREAMNAQIRALTGGDVTKEEQILAIDTWRALTELDAKALEAEEFKKSMNK